MFLSGCWRPDSMWPGDLESIRDVSEGRWFDEDEWNRLSLLLDQSDREILANWRDLKEEVIAWRLYKLVHTHLPELSHELLMAANFMGLPSGLQEAKEEDLARVPFRFDHQLVREIVILLYLPPKDDKALKRAFRKQLKQARWRRSLRKFLYQWPRIAALGYIGFVLLAFSKAQTPLETELVAGFVLLYAAVRFRFALAFPALDEHLSFVHRVLGDVEPPGERQLDGWSENWGRARSMRNQANLICANATVIIAVGNLLGAWHLL